MPSVNWERLSGDQVQEFVAALILLRWPSGNLITPSRGDRGVDIRVPIGEDFDIYQVKRYSRPPTAAQWREIENSWMTFLEQTASRLPIATWRLVTPWDPTNEALERLASVTANSGIHTEWTGRTQLDIWAAHNPSLVAYYFGDGADRLQELLAQALTAGSAPPVEGDLLAAVVQRATALQDALDQVDPFYRYEIEVRAGWVGADDWLRDVTARTGFVMASAEQVSTTHFALTLVYPRSAESASLRPIRQEITFAPEPGSREQAAVEDFVTYGAPFRDVRGAVTSAEGPPGTTTVGDGLFSFMLAADVASEMPQLEIRAVRHQGREVLKAVDASGVQRSVGLERTGAYLKCSDPSDCFSLVFLLGLDGQPTRLTLQWGDFAGKDPAPVVRALELFGSLGNEVGLELGIRGGPPITALFDVGSTNLQATCKALLPFLSALETIQRHTFARVVIPDSSSVTRQQERDAILAARLLRGEQIKGPWLSVETTVTAPDALPDFTSEFVMITEQPLVVVLGEVRIETDSHKRTAYASVRVDSPEDPSTIQLGDTLRLVPGTNPEAVQVAVPKTARLPLSTSGPAPITAEVRLHEC